MASGKNGSLRSLRNANRLRIVDVLRTDGSASRAEIARKTGLSRTTVSTLVGDLVDLGLVVEQPVPGDARRGRPPTLLSLEPSGGAAVGIDFDHDKLRVAVSDLARTVLAETSVPCDVDHDAGRSLDAAADLVADLLGEAGVSEERVLGCGMALAGPVDGRRGTAHRSAILPGWAGVDAAGELARRLGLPVHLDNDATLGALAEATFGAATGASHAAYVSISAGIGAGLIADGRPYRGHRGTAGEIGHILVDPEGPICRCGNRGCLETLASGPALVDLMRPSRGEITVRQIIDLAVEGDPGCRRAIDDAGRAVGRVLAALVNLFNPSLVVIGGDVAEAGDLLLGPMREAVGRFALPSATEDLEIVAGALGDRANLLGAVALVLTQAEHAVAARVAEVSTP
jgi:predicted NBD/HSP70 family sugar kinase/biotin operon repressor